MKKVSISMMAALLALAGQRSGARFKDLQPVRRETLTIECTYDKKRNYWEPRGGISSFANKIYLTATGQMKQK